MVLSLIDVMFETCEQWSRWKNARFIDDIVSPRGGISNNELR